MMIIDEGGSARRISDELGPDEQDLRKQVREQMPISSVTPIAIVLHPPDFIVPERLKELPVPPPDDTRNFLQRVVDGGEALIHATTLAWKWLPTIVSLIYAGITMDLKGVIKGIAAIAVGWLVAKGLVPQDMTIAGYHLQDIILYGTAMAGGWLWPQLRQLAPQWFRDIVGWTNGKS